MGSGHKCDTGDRLPTHHPLLPREDEAHASQDQEEGGEEDAGEGGPSEPSAKRAKTQLNLEAEKKKR